MVNYLFIWPAIYRAGRLFFELVNYFMASYLQGWSIVQWSFILWSKIFKKIVIKSQNFQVKLEKFQVLSKIFFKN